MQPIDDQQLDQRRAEIRHGLSRSNGAAVIILLLIVILAFWAIWQSFVATQAAEESNKYAMRASEASDLAESELWQSLQAQARASRLTSEAGRRTNALNAIASAAELKRSNELRDEAIAALAITGFGKVSSSPQLDYTRMEPEFDEALRRVAVLKDEHLLQVLRVSDWSPILEIPITNHHVQAMNMDPDGTFLAFRRASSIMELWNIDTKEVVWRRPATGVQSGLPHMHFLADRRSMIVTLNSRQLVEVQMEDGKETNRLDLTEPVSQVYVNPGQDRIATVNGRSVHIWDRVTGKLLHANSLPSSVYGLSWHPDNIRIALALQNSEIRLWDLRTGNTRKLDQHDGVVSHVHFSPDGNLLMSRGWDSTTRLWDVATGKLILSTTDGYGKRWNSDGTQIAWFNSNQRVGKWDIVQSPILRRTHTSYNSPDAILSVSHSPDSKLIVSTEHNLTQIWDAETLAPLASTRGQRLRTALFHPTTNWVISSSQQGLIRWALQSSTNRPGQLQFSQPTSMLTPRTSSFFERCAISSNNRHLAVVGGRDAAVIDLEKPNSPVWLKKTPPGLTQVAIGPQGKLVAIGTWKGWGLGVWNGETGEGIYKLSKKNASAAFSPDGKTLVVNTPSSYTIWNTTNWTVRHKVTRNHAGDAPGSIAFNHSGDVLAICSGWSPITLLNPDSGQVLGNLHPPHPRRIAWLAFNPQDTELAAATHSTSVDIWNVEVLDKRLSDLNLSWNQSTSPSPPPPIPSPLSSKSVGSPSWILWLPGLGVLIALGLGALTIHYHRRWLSHYAELEEVTVEQRNNLLRTQDELIQSQKLTALGTLAAGIAHDFNNLLSVIRLSNDLVGREVKEIPDLKEETDCIERAVSQGRSVVNSMLGYTRSQADAHGPIQLCDVAEDIVTMLRHQYLSGIQLQVHLSKDTPAVATRQSAAQQILMNLIVNASEAMQSTGTLQIEVSLQTPPTEGLINSPQTTDAHVVLTVTDNGPGMPEEDLKRIFEPFFTTKELGATPGRGLGLATVYMIAKQEKLGLAVTSRPGDGTTFQVAFPVAGSAPE